MVEIVDVEADVIQLRTVRRGWPSSCNVYLIRDGEHSVMVDAGLGVDPSLGELLTGLSVALARWGQTQRDVRGILLTHTHTDHAGGAMPIARQTGARVHVPARGWAEASDPRWQLHHILPDEVRKELAPHRDIDVVDHFREKTMPELFASGTDIDWTLVEDGDEIPVGRYRLKAFHLPGHDVAHLAWVDLQFRLGFTGDLMAARGTSLPWYPPNAGGVDRYLASLRQLQDLALQTACPGHNAVYRGATAIADLCATTRRMILDRDKMLLGALLAGPKSFRELDDVICDDAVRDVIPWASSVTMAHLARLDQIGVASRLDNGRYIAEPIACERHLREIEK
jgi:glyoxylase-like metal-dependent hydrolase (beta-lactamase superfamily II)